MKLGVWLGLGRQGRNSKKQTVSLLQDFTVSGPQRRSQTRHQINNEVDVMEIARDKDWNRWEILDEEDERKNYAN